MAIRECLNHEGFRGIVSHGSSTVPAYIVDEINRLGGNADRRLWNCRPVNCRKAARCGINKINVDTDIRLGCYPQYEGVFAGNPEKRNNNPSGPSMSFRV